MTRRVICARPYLTVRETLTLDAKLNGGGAADVDGVIARLGLAQCADTFVGRA
jgi:hypothetical protein